MFVICGCSKFLGETKNLLVCFFATHALEKMFVGRRNTNLSTKKDVTPINWSFALVDFWKAKWMRGDILHVCVRESERVYSVVVSRIMLFNVGFQLYINLMNHFHRIQRKKKTNSKNIHLIFLNDAYVRYLLTTITFVRYWHFWHFWVGDVFMRRQEQHHFALFIFYWYNIQ